MRLMSYNIEWFDECFEDDNSLKTTSEATTKLDAVAGVITATDPDLIGITEGPNTTTTTGARDTVAALRNFAAAKGLRQADAMIGFPSAGRQEIAAMFDPNVCSLQHDPGGRAGHKTNPPFNEAFQADSDADGIKELYKHYRPPLEAKVSRADGGADFWILVAHAKSKGIFSAMDRVHFERTSDRNRRKLFAECSSIRLRVEEWLEKTAHWLSWAISTMAQGLTTMKADLAAVPSNSSSGMFSMLMQCFGTRLDDQSLAGMDGSHRRRASRTALPTTKSMLSSTTS